MSYYSTYRWCAVPKCKNTSVKTKDKLWIQVPTDKNMRKTWFKVARRDPKLLSEKSRLYFCEDHFDLERDMENYIQYKIMGSVKRIRLKQHCIPSKFDCNRKPMPSSNESPPAEAKSLRISSTKDSVQVSEMSEDITQRNAQNCKNYYRRKKTANQGVVKKKTNSEKCRQYRQRKKLLAQQLQSKNEVIHTPSTSSLQMTFVPQLITTGFQLRAPGQIEYGSADSDKDDEPLSSLAKRRQGTAEPEIEKLDPEPSSTSNADQVISSTLLAVPYSQVIYLAKSPHQLQWEQNHGPKHLQSPLYYFKCMFDDSVM